MGLVAGGASLKLCVLLTFVPRKSLLRVEKVANDNDDDDDDK